MSLPNCSGAKKDHTHISKAVHIRHLKSLNCQMSEFVSVGEIISVYTIVSDVLKKIKYIQ